MTDLVADLDGEFVVDLGRVRTNRGLVLQYQALLTHLEKESGEYQGEEQQSVSDVGEAPYSTHGTAGGETTRNAGPQQRWYVRKGVGGTIFRDIVHKRAEDASW